MTSGVGVLSGKVRGSVSVISRSSVPGSSSGSSSVWSSLSSLGYDGLNATA
eukprot:CAMPEP_0170500782 /NCGR_PEP_ID=MMETSP0208-20121228/36063_1 /TAXON_ID=197538 /ORGANISM="Strombidium inclinatum, Strain S3" /LENGTH=50 /DNA_ID=CAMNT_0010778973 /DNA_START=1627 /DNA_END=1779 /DNA_ORIENTATION=-